MKVRRMGNGVMSDKQRDVHVKFLAKYPSRSTTPLAESEKRVGNSGRHKPKGAK